MDRNYRTKRRMARMDLKYFMETCMVISYRLTPIIQSVLRVSILLNGMIHHQSSICYDLSHSTAQTLKFHAVPVRVPVPYNISTF